MQPSEFPLQLVDARGKTLAPGNGVKVLAVGSCTAGLPATDQERLRTVVGEKRTIVEIDRFGFIWLSFSPSEKSADFCVMPAEVATD